MKKEIKPSSWKWPTIIFFIAFLAYSNTISFQYACDDNMYTYENKFIQKGISSLPDLINKGSLYGFNETNVADYRPAVLINFAIEKSLFGNSPKVNHFFNVLFFAILCILLLNLLSKLFKDLPIHVPIIISILFALHPIHTEVVANIKSRDEILCMLFGIMSINFLFDYQQNKKNYLLILSYVSFFICLLSKENGFSFLGLIPLVIYFFTNQSLRKILLQTIPFVLITVAVILIRTSVLDSNLFTRTFEVWQNSLVMATSKAEELATIFTMLFHAIWLFIFPMNLSWDYSYNQFPIVGWENAKAIISLLLYLILMLIAIKGLRKKSILSFAILFYFISYFITSNLVVKVGTTFAERFLFVPSLAFCIVLPFLVFRLFRIEIRNTTFTKARKVMILFLFVFICYGFRTISRNEDWRDNKSLHESGIITAPNSLWTHYLYAFDYSKKVVESKNSDQKISDAKIALREYQRCVEIYPEFATAYYEMGTLYTMTGDYENAIPMFKKTLELKPDLPEANYNYGLILFLRKDYPNALGLFLNAIKNKSEYTSALLGAGGCYRNMNDYPNAIIYFEMGLQTLPGNKDLMRNLSDMYKMTGDSAKAEYYNAMATLQ